MDMLYCVGYVGGKKTSVWTVWSLQATAEKRKSLLGQVSLCELLQLKENTQMNESMSMWTGKSERHATIIIIACKYQ